MRRREALQPEDVGLPRGQRRRTNGLRREEVAALCHMSTDYYSRLEQERGPQPSEQMIASIAQGLHLSRDERDHLFRLAGHQPPARGAGTDHISPGMLRIFDRLTDTPAEIVTELGETLRQTPLGVALVGDLCRYTGAVAQHRVPVVHRPGGARPLPARGSRVLLADVRLRAAGSARRCADPSRRPPGSRSCSPRRASEFRILWKEHEVGIRPREIKRYQHPDVGLLELNCQILLDPEQSQSLLVYTAVPGSESYEKLQLLSVIGAPLGPAAKA